MVFLCQLENKRPYSFDELFLFFCFSQTYQQKIFHLKRRKQKEGLQPSPSFRLRNVNLAPDKNANHSLTSDYLISDVFILPEKTAQHANLCTVYCVLSTFSA